MPNDVKPPSNAAPSAGTMSRGTLIGSSVVIGLTMMPKRPTITVASTQFAPARKSGEKPEDDGPLLVLRRGARRQPEAGEAEQGVQQRRASAITSAARISWFWGMTMSPKRLRALSSRILCGSCGVPPKRSWMMAWKTMNRPTEATTLASGGAKRSGRKTRKCRSSPTSAA